MKLRRGLGILLLALVLLPSAPALAAEVGVAPATRKILPDGDFPAATSAHVAAARNEWEPFQIAIRGASGIDGVDVSLSPLCSTQGHCVEASWARLYREHFLYVDRPSPGGLQLHDRLAGLYPDPLIPLVDPWGGGTDAAPFDLAAGELGVVLVDLYVPPDTPAGAYTGTITVHLGSEPDAVLPVTLTVWDFDIPTERTVATAFNFSASRVRRYHGGADVDPAPGYDDILDRYFLILHEHRIDRTTIDGPVDFTFDASDTLEPVDWTAYDDAVGPWIDGSRFPDGVGQTRFNVARFRPGSGLGSFTSDQYQQAAAAFAAHLTDRGWWDRAYLYSKDEPWLSDAEANYAQINEDASRLLAADPRWKDKILITGPYEPAIGDKVGIWTPVTPMYDDWFYYWDPMPDWDVYTERLALGESLWFYACNANMPPYAGYDLDTAIGYEPRILKWGAWFERATGFLYWRMDYWPQDDPWNVFANLENFAPIFARNGDGILLYPGDHDGTVAPLGSPPEVALHGPIASYRLKQIRDGLEDWEMFRLASDLGAEDYVRAQVARAYTRFGDFFLEDCDEPSFYCRDRQPWTLDEEVLLDARTNVARKVQFLLHPELYEDPEVTPDPTDLSDAGCSCRTPGPGGAPTALPLLLLAFLLIRRHRCSDPCTPLSGATKLRAYCQRS